MTTYVLIAYVEGKIVNITGPYPTVNAAQNAYRKDRGKMPDFWRFDIQSMFQPR